MGIERIRHEVYKPSPYTPRTTSGLTHTSASETPRTLHGVDAAFKGARYGDWMEHYSAPGKHGWVLWLLTAIILLGIVVMVLASKV